MRPHETSGYIEIRQTNKHQQLVAKERDGQEREIVKQKDINERYRVLEILETERNKYIFVVT